MAAKTINFNNQKKRYMTVVLPEREPLMLRMPSKGILADLVALQGELDGLGDGEIGIEALDAIYEVVAKMLSRNKQGVEVTQEEAEDLLDMEDLTVLLEAYMAFVTEGSDRKN